jgi:hypothetical protein
MQVQILKGKTRDVNREGGDGKSGRRGGRGGGERRVAGLRTLSTGTLTGLWFMQKYRFLTIAQFARVAGFSFITPQWFCVVWSAGG